MPSMPGPVPGSKDMVGGMDTALLARGCVVIGARRAEERGGEREDAHEGTWFDLGKRFV